MRRIFPKGRPIPEPVSAPAVVVVDPGMGDKTVTMRFACRTPSVAPLSAAMPVGIQPLPAGVAYQRATLNADGLVMARLQPPSPFSRFDIVLGQTQCDYNIRELTKRVGVSFTVNGGERTAHTIVDTGNIRGATDPLSVEAATDAAETLATLILDEIRPALITGILAELLRDRRDRR